jgi:hypothetical protein
MSVVFASCITWPFRRDWMRSPAQPGRQLIGGDERRAEAAGGLEVLADGPLRGLALVVAQRGVVEAGVAGDAGQGLLLGHLARGAADDQGELGLVIELVGNRRQAQRRAVRQQRGAAAHEQGR